MTALAAAGVQDLSPDLPDHAAVELPCKTASATELTPLRQKGESRAGRRAGVACAIGQPFDWRVAAETEIIGDRGVDSASDIQTRSIRRTEQVCPLWRRVRRRPRLRRGVQRPQQLILEPWYRYRAGLLLRGTLALSAW